MRNFKELFKESTKEAKKLLFTLLWEEKIPIEIFLTVEGQSKLANNIKYKKNICVIVKKVEYDEIEVQLVKKGKTGGISYYTPYRSNTNNNIMTIKVIEIKKIETKHHSPFVD